MCGMGDLHNARKKVHVSSCANLQFVNPGPHPMRCQSERKHETENKREGSEKKRRCLAPGSVLSLV